MQRNTIKVLPFMTHIYIYSIAFFWPQIIHYKTKYTFFCIQLHFFLKMESKISEATIIYTVLTINFSLSLIAIYIYKLYRNGQTSADL